MSLNQNSGLSHMDTFVSSASHYGSDDLDDTNNHDVTNMLHNFQTHNMSDNTFDEDGLSLDDKYSIEPLDSPHSNYSAHQSPHEFVGGIASMPQYPDDDDLSVDNPPPSISLDSPSHPPHVDPASDTSIPIDVDITKLMGLRERLLKMAVFAGLNRECEKSLTQLKKLHWHLLHRDKYLSVSAMIDEFGEYGTDYAPDGYVEGELETGLPHEDRMVTDMVSPDNISHYSTASVDKEQMGRPCKEAFWTILFVGLSLTAFFLAPSLNAVYNDSMASVSISILALSFIGSLVSILLLLTVPSLLLSLSCPVAMMSLFTLALTIALKAPDATYASVICVVLGVVIGLWGARTISYIANAQRLVNLALVIVREHAVLVPISVLATYITAVMSHYMLSSSLALVLRTTQHQVGDYTIKLVSLTNANVLASVLIIPILIISWVWTVEIIRYILQSITHGIVAFHYHLSPSPSSPSSIPPSQQLTSVTLSEYLSLPTLPAAITITTPRWLGLALLCRIIIHSFGSVVHGSLLATPARIFWLSCRKLGKLTRTYRHRRSSGCVTSTVRTLLQWGERLYSRWAKHAYRLVMIWGYRFSYASSVTYSDFLLHGTDTLLNDMVVEGFVVLIAAAVAACSGILSLFLLPPIMTATEVAEATHFTAHSYAITHFAAAAICFCVMSSVFLSVSIVLDAASTSVVAIYACYAENPIGMIKYDRLMAANILSKLEFEADGEREERVIAESYDY